MRNGVNRSPSSTQRQIRPPTAAAGRRPNPQHSVSQLGRTRPLAAASSALSAARNRSMEWNAAIRPKPSPTTTKATDDTAHRRQLVRPSQTTSATSATKWPAISTLPALRSASRQLQRKIGAKTEAASERQPVARKAQTYAVKKPPLPYKVGTRFYLVIKYKKLTGLHYCVRATKSHIQNSRNHFSKIQSDRMTNWLPLQTHVT